MSTKEIIEGSVPVFKSNKGLQKVHATSDGQYFFEKNRANLYKNSKKNPVTGKDTLSVSTITREEAITKTKEVKKVDKVEKAAFLKQNVGDIKTAVKDESDAKVLKVYLTEEEANEPRSTAVDVIKARIEEIENPAK